MMVMLGVAVIITATSDDEPEAPVLDRLIVAQGTEAGVPWQAVAHGRADRPCLEVRAGGSGGSVSSTCWGDRRRGEMAGPPVVARFGSLFLLGVPVDSQIAQAALAYADGSTASAGAVGATRFQASFVLVPLRGGQTITSIRFLDTNGEARWKIECPASTAETPLPPGCRAGPVRQT